MEMETKQDDIFEVFPGVFLDWTNKEVHMKCSVCGKDMRVKWNTYLQKKPGVPWRCRRCNDDYRNSLYASKSDEEKNAYVEKQRGNIKKYWANMKPEDREKESQRRKDVWKNLWKTGKAKEKLEHMQKWQQEWYKKLPEEEKSRRWKLMDKGRQKWWDGLSEEEKMAEAKRLGEEARKWYDGLSKEEFDKHIKRLRDANQKFWDNMTREKYFEWMVELKSKIKEMKDQGIEVPDNHTPTPTEIDFMNELNKNKLPFIFHYPSVIIHPEFNDKFPVNMITESDLVDPTHMWDFKVHTEKGDVFIDIDGSVHKNNDITKFNDSKRPYQTDSLPAYAIQCYDDAFTMDNKVTNLTTGEEMNVVQLISLLNAMNDQRL